MKFYTIVCIYNYLFSSITNYIDMNSINDLKDKYAKAHEAYLKYKDTNKTNNIEAQFMPEVLAYLNESLKGYVIIMIPDCLLNFLGLDIIAVRNERIITYDVKICQHLHNNEVMVDGWKHDKQGNWYNALDDKLNDFFIFVNNDNIIVTTAKAVRNRIPPESECFFLRRDLYHTTKKAVIDLSGARKLVTKRIK